MKKFMLLSKEGVNMEVKVYAKGRTNNYEAYGIFDGKGLVVKKGSRVSEKIAANVNLIVLKKRKECVSSDYITKEDVSFRSPSTAAAFVSGNVSNGFRVWKVEKSIDLGKYRENKKNGRH